VAIASVGTMGTGVSSTSSTTFTLSTATNTLASGDFALLTVATDNTSTADGNTSDHTAVSGGTGTWSKLGEYTNTVGGAAADGVTTSVWLFEATGAVGTGTTITITLGTARVDKVASMWKFTKAASTTIHKDTEPATNPLNNGVDASNGFGSVAFSGLSSKSRLYYRGLGKEANTTTAITVSTSPATFTAITGNRSRNNASAITLRGEFLINTGTGATSNPTLAVTGDTAGVFVALVEIANQTLTPSLFTNDNTFYAPTVTVGSVTLTPSLFSNTNTFYAATVSQGAPQDLTASLFTNSQTFYAPTVTRGTVTLTPSLFTNSQTFYGPTVTRGAVTLSPSLFSNSQTFYAATVTPGTTTLQAGLFTNSQTFYAPTVTGGVVPETPTRTTRAGTKRNYIIKGQKLRLTEYELALLIQEMMPKRAEVRIVEKEEVRTIGRNLWKKLRDTNDRLDSLKLADVQKAIENAVIEVEVSKPKTDDDDEELIMLLL